MRLQHFVFACLTCLVLCGFQTPPKPTKASGAGSKRPVALEKQAQDSHQPSNLTPALAEPNHKEGPQRVDVVSLPQPMRTQSERDFVDYIAIICTILLTIVGGIGTWAAVRSLIQIRRQADILVEHRAHLERLAEAASSNAAAAKASADALINGERAWIVTRITWQPGAGRELVNTSGDGERSTWLNVILKFRNDGRTPAWITNQRVWCNLCDETPPAMPDTSLPPSFSRLGPDPISIGRRVKQSTNLQCKGVREPMGRALIIYGVVNYRDAFGEHETWCGYIVRGAADSPRLERLAGYEHYNRYT